MMRTWSIRSRLALWNTCVTIIVILMVGVAAYWMMAETLLARTDAVLDFEFRETAERLNDDEDGLDSEEPDADIPAVFLEEFLLRVTDEKGGILLESPRLKGRAISFPTDARASVRHFSDVIQGFGRHRLIAGPIAHQGESGQALIAVSLADFDQELADFRRSLFYVLPIAIVAAAAGGYWLAGRALCPIHVMTESARKISERSLHERIDVENAHDELGRLATTLNEVFDRLANSMDATRRFTADASHELMTPLAIIRTEAEVALQAPRSSDEYSEVLRDIVSETTRLTRLADRLLTLARAESTHARSTPAKLLIVDSLRDAVTRFSPQAAIKSVTIRSESPPDAFVLADSEQLAQVFHNLLDNAVKYNRPQGDVIVRGRTTTDEVVIEFADTGIGIRAADLPHVFERFYRADASRSGAGGSAGLGLSIVRTLAESMGGRVEVESELGVGTTFRLTLPRVDEK